MITPLKDSKMQTENCKQKNMKQATSLISDRKLRSIKSERLLFNSQQSHPEKQIQHRFQQLRVLTKEKDCLMEQLNILKEGAVSALRQKEEIIDRLKNENLRTLYFEDQKQQMQKELNKYHRKMNDLQEQKNDLNQKLVKERTFFFEQLYNKQNLIEELSNKIVALEGELVQKKEQNAKLTKQVFNFEKNEEFYEKQIIKIKDQLQTFSNIKESTLKEESWKDIHETPSKDAWEKRRKQWINESQSESTSNIIDKIIEEHKQQISQIINYYESQMRILRNLYEQQANENMHLKRTLQTQTFSDPSQNEEVYDLQSIQNTSTNINFYQQEQNISNYQDKTAIQKQMSSGNLRNELKQLKRSSEQDRSQFTSNYFYYDHRVKLSYTPGESIQSNKNINLIENLVITPLQTDYQKINYQKPLKNDCKANKENNNESQRDQQTPNAISSRITRKQAIYCLGGTLLGVIATTLVSNILSRK